MQTSIRQHLLTPMLILLMLEMFFPQSIAAGTGLPTTISLFTSPGYGCATSSYPVALPAGSLINIEMRSDQTVYLYLMTSQVYSSWSTRNMCNSPGPDISLYETIDKQFGYTLHWTPPYGGTFYFVFEYDARFPLSATVNLIDRSSIPLSTTASILSSTSYQPSITKIATVSTYTTSYQTSSSLNRSQSSFTTDYTTSLQPAFILILAAAIVIGLLALRRRRGSKRKDDTVVW